MKRLLSLMLVTSLVTITQAASINWGFSGITTSAKQIKDSTGTAMSADLYLILESDAAALANALPKDFETTLSSIALGNPQAVTNGRISSSATANSTKLTAREDGGSQYNYQVVVYDAANSVYYLSGTQSEYAYSTTADPVTPTSITFDYTLIGETYRTNKNITWKPAGAVPEPATGALALAGVALLFRRRKA